MAPKKKVNNGYAHTLMHAVGSSNGPPLQLAC